MFCEEKVTQMAAYLLIKSHGQKMKYLKLMKLLYLAERESMSKWGESMSGDRFVSMPRGPVLSQTLNLINGGSSSENGGWQSFIKDESDHMVSLKDGIDEDSIDELSRAELQILDDTYKKFGYYPTFGRGGIVEYTHTNCSEWQDPMGSAFPIKDESILRAVGKTEEQISAMIKHGQEQKALDSVRARLK